METSSTQPISLGELSDLLESRPADQRIVFDFCGVVPRELSSYRGYYDHLAFEWEYEGAENTVGAVLAGLKGAIGKVYEGYKGGDFRMSRRTPLWVSNYGRSDSTCVTGIIGTSYQTIITTGHCEDWAGGSARAMQVLFGGLGFGNAHLPSET